ncbi:odorant receptor 4-like [Venturia canescens]|uniref:odorant receptor 4-like n=1 Tax=Venturia canescens TaxID=32260 RepID=UPI001C9CAD94|nr:odorant receptor 4-like [Venturia canescens]
MSTKVVSLRLDQNYLTWYFQLLTIFGMWNPWKEDNVEKRLYTWYAVGLFCFAGVPPSLGEIIHAWKSRNVVMFTQHFTLVTAMLSTMVKIVNLWRRRPDLETVANLLNWERRQVCNRKFAIYRDRVIISTIRACKLFGWAFIIMVIWYCCFSYGKVVVYSRGDANQISTSPLWVFNANGTPSYWLMFVTDKITISYLAGCTAFHDIFFTVFLIHVGAQLDLLKQRLEWCRDDVRDTNGFNFISNDFALYDLKLECVCRSISEESSLDPIVELYTCIQHHQIILRYANLLQSIFNNTLLLQFGTSLLIISMAGFQILGKQELSTNELIDTMNFLMCALFQLFLYCWFGTIIISKSETISLSAYYSKWYDTDIRFKKTLNILLFRGQVPIKFRAGYICELSSQTFMQIISKCYSSMALLQQVND